MTWTPRGVAPQTITAGQHEVVLAEFKPIDKPETLAKLNAQAAFKAVYKDLDTAIEIEHLITFTGTRRDFYSGQHIERLHLAAGLPVPVEGEDLNITDLVLALDGVCFFVNINDKGYVQDIQAPEPPAGTGTEGAPF